MNRSDAVNPLVSVIVPVYNAKRYIHTCIDSILAQTYRNIEVLLVDDGSTDQSGEICDEYAAREARVKVFHQTNGGVSTARNKGIECSKGQYIAFVDSDDSVETTYLEGLLAGSDAITPPLSDFIIGGFVSEEKRLGRRKVHRTQLSDEIYSGQKELAEYFNKHFCKLYSTVPWGKIYKASLMKANDIRFDSRIRLGEDLIFNLEYLKHCHSVKLTSCSRYNYTTQNIPSEEKYKLGLEEIAYFSQTMSQKTEELGKTWGAVLNSSLSANIVISMYPLSQVFKDPKPYFQLYKEFGSSTDCLHDYHCSPIYRGIHLAKGYVKTFRILFALKVLLAVRRHYGDIVPTLSYSGLDRYMSYLCRR